MPFYDDSGIRTEEHRGPLFSAIALIYDQIERMIALNIAWCLQLLPAVLALAVPSVPLWARVLLIAYSAISFVPATGVLFHMLSRSGQGEMLSVAMLREELSHTWLASLLTLLPLYSIFGWLSLLAVWAAGRGWLIVDVLARLSILILVMCSIFWGPLFVERPRQIWLILKRSVQLVSRYPLITTLSGLAILLAIALGVVSVGGLFLIAPVFIAMLEIRLYVHINKNARKQKTST